MDIEKLKKVKKVVVHADCHDGILSAMILQDAMALPKENIIFVEHSTPEYVNLPAEPGMLFCDCTPPKERIQEFIDVGALVLDHHKHSRDIVEAFGDNGVFADKEKEPEVSGAALAFREVWCSGKNNQYSELGFFVKDLAQLIGIRDNWQQQSPKWQEACEAAAVLMFFPIENWVGQETLWSIRRVWANYYKPFGKILFQKDKERAKAIANKRWIYRTTSGLVIAIVNSRFINDAADLLEDQCDVVMGFAYTKNEPGEYPGMKISLRGFGSFDCGKFAKHYGGGGHFSAGGCKFQTLESTENPYTFLCKQMEQYLDDTTIHIPPTEFL